MKIGSHVGMSGKDMLLGSAKEAVSYGADTFMFYTGAPQNTRRKEISELNIGPSGSWPWSWSGPPPAGAGSSSCTPGRMWEPGWTQASARSSGA